MKSVFQKFGMLTAMLLASLNISAYDFEVDGIYYSIISLSDLTCKVVSGNTSYRGEVVIPNNVTYNNRTLSVKAIGARAFTNSYLTSVTIPASVDSIYDDAFYFGYLKSIYFEDSPNPIGIGKTSRSRSAFYYSKDIDYVYLGRNVTPTRYLVFPNIKYLEIGGMRNQAPILSSLTSSLTDTIYIGNSVLSLPDSFLCNSTVKSVEFAENSRLSEIGYRAFCNCDSLTGINLPKSVTVIGDYAFLDCDFIKSISIPDSVTVINHGTFYNCSRLSDIRLPKSLTSIKEVAFYDCNLSEVEIPDEVTFIGSDAFNCCYYLREFVSPPLLTSLGSGAFWNCHYLTKIDLSASSSLSTINSDTFIGCRDLTNLSLPEGLEEINATFDYCYNLSTIKLLSPTPPKVSSDAFLNKQYLNTTVIVPDGSLSAYQSADTWKNFWNIVEEGSTAIEETKADAQSVYVRNGKVVVDGVASTIYIYGIGGTLVKKVTPVNTKTEITLGNSGQYIVKVGNKSYNIIL